MDKNTTFMRLVGIAGNLMPVGLIAFVLAALVGIFQLGLVFKLGVIYSGFVALGSIALVLGHAGSIQNSSANAQRLLHGLGLLVWIVLILFFVVLYFGLASVGVTAEMSEAEITLKLADSFVSAELLASGQTLFSYAVAIGLATALSATVVSYAMAHPLVDQLHTSMGSAFATMGINIGVGLIVLISGLHVLNFGMKFGGVGALEAVVACVMAEITFIAAEKQCERELKARATTQTFDKFDLIMWGGLAFIALLYMGLINLTYAEMARAAALYPTDALAGLKAANAATDSGIFALSKQLYGVSAQIFGGLLVFLGIITKFVNVTSTRKEAGLDNGSKPPPYRVINPNRTRPVTRLNKDGSTPTPEIERTGQDDDDETAQDDDDTAVQHGPPLTAKGTDMHDLRNRQRTDKEKVCAQCNKTFIAKRADARYCCENCRKTAHRERTDDA